MRLARVALTVAFGALAAYAFGPAFGGSPPLPVLLAVGVAGLVSVAAVARAAPTLLTTAGAAGVVVAACLSARAGVDVLSGPVRLLTGAVPAERTGAGVAAVAILAGWGTLAGGIWAASAAHPLPALLPALLCLGAALGLGAGAGGLPAWYAPALVAIIAALLLLRSPGSTVYRGQTWRARIGRAWAPLLAVGAVATVWLLGPVLGRLDAEPADLRALVAAPVQPRSGVSPLQQYLALRDGSRPLRVTGTTSRPGVALRLATLTAFDGTYWTVRGDYRRAGTALAPGPAGGSRVDVHVEVAAGELDWLLSPGRPVRVSLPALGVDEATGDVAVPAGASPPRTYDASAVVTEPSAAAVLAADAAPAPGPLTPPLPPALASFAAGAVADAPDGPDELLALRHRFADAGDFRYDQAQEVTGGHGYFQIKRLLDTKRGTSEQYASAFAVMARHLGFDARVVMGFRPEYDGSSFTITGRDVDAWVEVRFTTLGWVTIDPSPRANPIGTRPGAPAAGRAAGAQDPLAKPPAPTELPPPGVDSAGARPGSTTPTVWWPATLAAVAGLLTAALLVPAAKAVRRVRRRRDRSVRRSIVGAWWETVDGLRESGLALAPSLTTTEVAARAGGPPALLALGGLVDRAVFAPGEPDEPARQAAWTAARAIRRDLAGRRPAPRRLLAWFDPRPLRRPDR